MKQHGNSLEETNQKKTKNRAFETAGINNLIIK